MNFRKMLRRFGWLEMKQLKEIEDIKTAEIAQRVLDANENCGGTVCSKCYNGNVSCLDAVRVARDILERATDGKYLRSIDDIKTVEIAQRAIREHDSCAGKSCDDCFLCNVDDGCVKAYEFAQDFLEKAKSSKKSEPEPAVPSIQWIDERLLIPGAPAKKIQTVEEAFAILVEHETCSGRDCVNCGIRMYEKKKGGGCKGVTNEAKKFLALELGLDPSQHLDGSYVYSYLMKQPIPAIPAKESTPVIDRASCKTCNACKNYNPVGGVPFCNAWHNWTSPDGNCYMFNPLGENPLEETVKLGEPETVEVTVEAATESSDDEAALPF